MNYNILFLGMPSSGKTTFISALWYYLTSGEPDLTLKVDSLSKGDETYLNEIRDYWLKFDTVPRTYNRANGELVLMKLINTANQAIFTLKVPDLSGEVFQLHFEERLWSEDYFKIVSDINGLILFVHPENDNKPKYIQYVNDLLSYSSIEPQEKTEVIPYHSEHTPNQVKLVESLQFIRHHCPNIKNLKIALIISAWDRIEASFGENTDPQLILKKELPLLFQYIESNNEFFTSKYYGVSAQGSNYDNDSIYDRLPSERIIIKDSCSRTNEIAKPIIWLTE